MVPAPITGTVLGEEPGMDTAVPVAAATAKPPEPAQERYLRHIRNYVAVAFWVWIVGSIIAAIVVIAVSAHANAVNQNNACNAQGGVMIGGQCQTF